MNSFRVRTDLALEARENMEDDAEGLRGVKKKVMMKKAKSG